MIMQPFPAKTRKRVKFMSYTKIAAIYADSEALSGQTVTVGGWVRTIRDMKTFGFIELNDGSCFKNLQVVMEAGTLENYKDIAAQNVGAALIVTGTEMFRVTTLDPKNPPMTEDGEVDFSQDFFGKPANLTVSGQLNAENFAMAFGDVYTFGPTFRAENSNTQRHAAEFWMIEPEMAFTDLKGDMDVAEAMIKFVIRQVMEKCPQELAFFNSFVDKGLLERLEHVASSDFGRVTYTEAVAILEQHNDLFDYKVSWGCDLQTEHERYLTEQVYKKPVFVTDYPKEIKAFYMRLNDDGKTVAAADCLVPGIGEIIGGSQREERLEILESRIRELGMNPKDYWWYCDLRRYGSCKHAGFGLGFERLVMYLTGVSNIRDVLPHPRTVGSADF